MRASCVFTASLFAAVLTTMTGAAMTVGVGAHAQDLRTLSNGAVADADDLNHNFVQLNDAVAAVAGSGPFDPQRHVILNDEFVASSPCTDNRAFVRINLDGSANNAEFIVPTGFTLFITDVSWQTIDNPTSLIAGRTLSLNLFASNANGSNSRQVYASPKIEITSGNNFGRPGASDSLTSGFAVGQGRIICPSLFNQSQSSSTRNTITSAVLLGFLVPN